ncbi:FAD-binding and (Fe-S)-binding domain-containing protein [Noviherbaspirillum galbum]|uniref:FAD-binding protein n=1 Tax=Noviherbaspirillum galbum TaxID=2709383 RepID=A0A6B3SRD1_9BURK|nr:FAD-binding and (Fe-S)-binding domain-containing protein [Noviherbaspirillum galbum]NEX63088.1 FAD-binding protein [Noviherbaspirillum galbum]
MNASVPSNVLLSADVQSRLDNQQLAARLAKETAGEVLFDRLSRGRYSTDASIYQIEPVGVFVPRTEDDVATAMAIARDARVPVLPRGAGTSQCGQTVGAALVIDNSKYLKKVVDFDKEAMTVTVQPGIVLDHLNAWLKPNGLWFPVDVSTAAQCTIGGMAGNNSCGSRSLHYGNMVHNVLAIDAWLSDGTGARFESLDAMRAGASGRMRGLIDTIAAIAGREHEEIAARYPRVLRRVGGYNLDVFHPQSERPYTADGSVNLAHLLVGSEGTLAYSRQVTLKLAPLPKSKALGIVNFTNFNKAMDSTRHIVRLRPVAVELVDRTMIELARGNPAFRQTIEKALIGSPDAILLVEFAGEDKAEQVRKLKDLVALMGDLGLPGTVVEMPDEKEQKELWEVRKAGLNIMMSLKGDGKPVSFIEDCAVPLEHLAEYTDRLTEVFARHGTRGTWYAHASVGTLHVRPILDMRRDGSAKMRAIAEEAGALVRKYKGAFSGEHGDGLVRSEWVDWQFGERMMNAFREIKDAFDPQGLMNPGKIVRATKMDDASLYRFKPGYAELPLKTALDWSAWNVKADPVTEQVSAPGTGGDATGGFAKAIEMCNNNGHCRKFDGGTMCPSYRVTKDEQHLTRGRANSLRLAVSGQLGPDAFTSDALYDTMDLCVGCKGCKRDCPTGIDMARMKTEFLYHYRRKHGMRLKDRLVAGLPRYAPLASRLAPLFNLRDAIPGVAGLTEKWLGFSARRKLPQWRTDTFLSRAKAAQPTRGVAEAGEVVLFADTFNNYFEAENAHAALRVLEAAGYRVHLARAAGESRPLCCGRTYLAAGQVDEAKQEARRTLDALLPFVRRGVPVVGLEPSCLLTMRDEFLAYGFGEEARALSESALLFEEFLAREARAGKLKLALKALPQSTALLHGHCHQKAFDAVKPVQVVLGLIPGLQVKLIESSCCGMAGSFGYEAKHYDVSMKMAEQSLLPAVREAGTNALIVADGTSCRHQIADGAQREAVHVARVLEAALA